MFTKVFTVAALIVLGVQAAPAVPARRDGDVSSSTASAASSTTTSFTPLSEIALPTGSPEQVLSFVQANSQSLALAVGNTTFLELEASLVMAEAATVIPATETQLSLFLAVNKATPIVQVSSIGGEGITLATGTEGTGVPTTIAGHVFTAAPKANDARTSLHLPAGLFSGAAAVLGSVVLGAVAVL
ncbi:hypothetical protein C8Q77DRAFT_1158268 [Trametes polyzona]|nr:hypothetical protein C8Q77DRAFT_1158268 [Trametes polyzona]